MKTVKEAMLLYGVTDRRWTGSQSLTQQVELALKGGITCVQLREKQLDENAFLREALEIRELCHSYGVPLLINDNVDIALRSGADGVHVGQSDMEARNVRQLLGPDKIIGVTARTVEQALAAQAAGASYLGSGAVFGTSTKADARPLSYEQLQAICRAVDIPVVAIGGITRDNILDLTGSGADGVALVSSIFGAEDIEEECHLLHDLSCRMVGR